MNDVNFHHANIFNVKQYARKSDRRTQPIEEDEEDTHGISGCRQTLSIRAAVVRAAGTILSMIIDRSHTSVLSTVKSLTGLIFAVDLKLGQAQYARELALLEGVGALLVVVDEP